MRSSSFLTSDNICDSVIEEFFLRFDESHPSFRYKIFSDTNSTSFKKNSGSVLLKAARITPWSEVSTCTFNSWSSHDGPKSEILISSSKIISSIFSQMRWILFLPILVILHYCFSVSRCAYLIFFLFCIKRFPTMSTM